MSTPEEIAKSNLARALRRFVAREQQRLEKMAERENNKQQANYDRYDADTGVHIVKLRGGEEDYAQGNLTNAGLQAGDRVEYVGRNIDSMPRFLDEIPEEPIPPDIDPVWGVLIKRRAYIRTDQVYIPPRPPQYSDPQPAQWSMVYYSGLGAPVPDGWSPGNQIRYATDGSSRLLCGPAGGVDTYCRLSFPEWKFIPAANLTTFGYLGPRCHFAFVIPNPDEPGKHFFKAGIVIGALAFSPDGFSQVPSDPPYTLPKVYERRYIDVGVNQREYLDCSLSQDDPEYEVDMEWQLLEVIPFAPYVPPQLIDGGFPGGVSPVPRFETQWWLLTAQGPVKVATVPDWQPLPEQGNLWRELPTVPLLSVDENGVLHLDLRITNFTPDFTDTFTELKHYQVQGLAVSEVELSTSWRRNRVNSPTNTPLPDPVSHPCINLYQSSNTHNIFENDRKIARITTPTLPEIKAGKTVKVEFWTLPPGPGCTLPVNVEETKDVVILPFDDTLIGADPQDEALPSVLAMAAYL